MELYKKFYWDIAEYYFILVPKAGIEWVFISYTYSSLSISPTINQSQIKFSTNFYHSIF